MRKASRTLLAGVVGLMLLTLARAAPDAAPAQEPANAWSELREKTFNVVWETVNESYYDPQFGGVDWPAIREKYRARLPQAADKGALNGLLMGMLGELRRTHFSILPRGMAVFTPEERGRNGTSLVDVIYTEGGVVVSTVRPEVTAAVRPGDLVRAIDQVELESLEKQLHAANVTDERCGLYLTQLVKSRLRGAVGTKVRLRLQGLDGKDRETELTIVPQEGEWSEPMGDFPSFPVETVAEANAEDRLVYLRFNVFARQAMKEIRTALNAVPSDGGLVIDLRGNPGGITLMAAGISGWLSDRTFLLATMHMRQGHIGFTVSPQPRAFLGPVAILIDSDSVSTSEIMAAGLQEAGRARIFGEPSPGAALPSVFKALPTGDLFQYAIADLQTPRGILIEGHGVIPDQIVARTRTDLAAGRDPVLSAARRWLEAQRHNPEPRP
jgi:carboxyl-terminal processing protease